MTDKLEIFNELQAILATYSPPLVAVNDYEARYELSSKKEVMIEGRKKGEVYFGAVIIQSNYVGYYMMSAYMTDMASGLLPELKKCLKGKTCFHIKKLDDKLLKQIEDFTAESFDYYKTQNWV